MASRACCVCSLDLGLEEKNCVRRLPLELEGRLSRIFSGLDMAAGEDEDEEKGFASRRGISPAGRCRLGVVVFVLFESGVENAERLWEAAGKGQHAKLQFNTSRPSDK